MATKEQVKKLRDDFEKSHDTKAIVKKGVPTRLYLEWLENVAVKHFIKNK